MKLIARYENIKNQNIEYFEIFSDNIEILDKNDIALDMLNYQLDYDNPNHREMFLKNKEIYPKTELDKQFNEFLEYDYDNNIKESQFHEYLKKFYDNNLNEVITLKNWFNAKDINNHYKQIKKEFDRF